MKRLLFSLMLAMGIIISMNAKEIVAGGKTYTAMGDYQITTCDQPCIVNGKELPTFTVKYENSPMELKIVIDECKKETVYIVSSDVLGVKYVQNKKYFGIGEIVNGNNFNKDEYYHQKVLTSGQSEKGSLMLISVYFPYLLKG